MRHYKAGDIVIFTCPFQNTDALVERGDIGVVRKAGPQISPFVSVISKGIIWLTKPSEIRNPTQNELDIQIRKDGFVDNYYARIYRYMNEIHETGFTDTREDAIQLAKNWIKEHLCNS